MARLPDGLSPAEKFVLACVRMDAEGEGEISALLAGHLNWDAVYEAGLRHAVLPLLYQGLQKANQGLLPEGAGVIRDAYRSNAHRNLHLAKTALQLSELLHQQGVESLLIKGPATAVLAYADLSLRSFVDLDLLIRPRDFFLSHQALLDHGWQPALSLQEKELRWLLRGDKDLSYHQKGLNLELHWNIAEKGIAYPLRESDLWEDLQSFPLLDRQVRTLSRENFLLFLALHGAKHHWRPLKFIVDFAACLRSFPDIDWEYLDLKSKHFGLRRCLTLGMFLAQQYCGGSLPSDLQAVFQAHPPVPRLAGRVQAHLFSAGERVAAQTIFYLQTRERAQDKLYYILDQALVPKRDDWLAVSLPAPLYPFYYLLRPLRLIHKFGRMLLKDLSLSQLKARWPSIKP
jgi:hypothetical protein